MRAAARRRWPHAAILRHGEPRGEENSAQVGAVRYRAGSSARSAARPRRPDPFSSAGELSPFPPRHCLGGGRARAGGGRVFRAPWRPPGRWRRKERKLTACPAACASTCCSGPGPEEEWVELGLSCLRVGQPRISAGYGGSRRSQSLYSHLEKMTDLVAVWEVALSDGVHKIEFEHGTTSGKRVVYVDGKEEIRKEWMFKLVGKETFTVGASKTKATINIDAVSGFAYEYTLEINGKSLKKYMENRSKTTNTWVLSLGGADYRVVLEKDTMDVWCNGQKMETAGEFVEDGTETHFSVGDHSCCIKAVSSGKRKEGIIHTLIVDDREIPETVE